jgi:hypothetical protein
MSPHPEGVAERCVSKDDAVEVEIAPATVLHALPWPFRKSDFMTCEVIDRVARTFDSRSAGASGTIEGDRP